ncbi:MAG: GNAT family N-acetyltransferase [Butyrivibrio sp.]|nr:GNAT family N-acetyltransferase [Acetatifactor muris]MCM1558912.1 GNAT family N-acetyltransferase [Butyrivibrio sp.]
MCEQKYVIFRTDDRSLKLDAIRDCDEAFTISVIGRDSFEELFEKIDKKAFFYVALDTPKNIMGYIVFYANDFESKQAYITLLVVRSEFQRMHIGTELVKECCKMCRARGFEMVRLKVLNRDVKARSFYRKVGFADCDDAVSREDSRYMELRIV